MKSLIIGCFVWLSILTSTVVIAQVNDEAPLMNFELMGEVQEYSKRDGVINIGGKKFVFNESLKIHNFASNSKEAPLGLGARVGYKTSLEPGKRNHILAIWVLEAAPQKP